MYVMELETEKIELLKEITELKSDKDELLIVLQATLLDFQKDQIIETLLEHGKSV